MINQQEHSVSWALLLAELDEAREHLEELVDKMNRTGAIDDADFSIEMGHIYAHLNRACHSRNQDGEITRAQWPVFSQFPKDIKPVG